MVGDIPLNVGIREASDCGKPIVVSRPASEQVTFIRSSRFVLFQRILLSGEMLHGNRRESY